MVSGYIKNLLQPDIFERKRYMKYMKLNKDFYLEPYTPSRYFLLLKNGGESG